MVGRPRPGAHEPLPRRCVQLLRTRRNHTASAPRCQGNDGYFMLEIL